MRSPEAGTTVACENSRPSSLPARVAFRVTRNATRAPPFLHSSGIFSSVHILLQKSKRTSSDMSPPALFASGGTLSHPVAFQFFNFFIAFLISIRVMRHVLMLSSSFASTSGGNSGSSRLSTVWKCSLHQCISSSADLSNTPALVLTGLHVFWNLPLNFLVISYEVLASPLFPVSSAFSASDSTYTLLSLLHLLFISLVSVLVVTMFMVFLPPFAARLPPKSPCWSTSSYLPLPYSEPARRSPRNLVRSASIIHWAHLLLHQLLQTLKFVVQC